MPLLVIQTTPASATRRSDTRAARSRARLRSPPCRHRPMSRVRPLTIHTHDAKKSSVSAISSTSATSDHPPTQRSLGHAPAGRGPSAPSRVPDARSRRHRPKRSTRRAQKGRPAASRGAPPPALRRRRVHQNKIEGRTAVRPSANTVHCYLVIVGHMPRVKHTYPTTEGHYETITEHYHAIKVS